MRVDWLGVINAVLWPPAWAFIWSRVACRIWRLDGFDRVAWPWFAAGICNVLSEVLGGEWLLVAISAVQVVIAVTLWIRRRKKRDPVAKLIGAKARARRDALVRRAREVARPRPVLKPAPVPR